MNHVSAASWSLKELDGRSSNPPLSRMAHGPKVTQARRIANFSSALRARLRPWTSQSHSQKCPGPVLSPRLRPRGAGALYPDLRRPGPGPADRPPPHPGGYAPEKPGVSHLYRHLSGHPGLGHGHRHRRPGQRHRHRGGGQCVAPATFIRLGTSGALQDYIELGDLVITESARREENTTHSYAPAEVKCPGPPAGRGGPAARRPPLLRCLITSGLTCTTADFYAGQGRVAPGFPTLDPDKVARLSRAGVLNLEMEMSAYLTLAAVSTFNLRAGGACVVLNNRLNGRGLPRPGSARRAERRLIDVGLRALEILAAKDQTGENGGQRWKRREKSNKAKRNFGEPCATQCTGWKACAPPKTDH